MSPFEVAPSLKSVVVNVRPASNTYAAIPVRFLKAVGLVQGIEVQLGSIEPGGGHLRLVEGSSVGVIRNVAGLVGRQANGCSVLAIDAPVRPEHLQQDCAPIGALKRELRNSGVGHVIFMVDSAPQFSTTETVIKNALLKERVLLGRFGHVDAFDPLFRRHGGGPASLQGLPDTFFDEPGKPFASYCVSGSTGVPTLDHFLQIYVTNAKHDKFVRSVLDGDLAATGT